MVEGADWFSPDASETVVWHGKPRTRRIIPRVAGAVVLTALAVGFAAVAPAGGLDGGTLVVVWGAAGLVVLGAVAWVGLAYLRVRATDYVLTDRNVYKKTGVFSERVSRVGLDRIQNTTLKKDVTGNLFDYGTVLLSTAGSGGTALAVTDLDDPEQFRDELGPLVDASGGPGRDAFEAGGTEPVLDDATVEAMVPEARRLRESAQRLERQFDS
ncbi:MAG: PH domain-containing protein [Haloarculaceae archaeon]